jgi:hypothetical protein
MSNTNDHAVGKLRNGFLTDFAGRRIYFPAIGPARWVPSQDEESNFRGLVMWWGTALGVVLYITTATTLALLSYDAGALIVLIFAVPFLRASCLARRWPIMDDPTMTYHRAMLITQLQKSDRRLWFEILASVLGAIALTALPIWLLWFGSVEWVTSAKERLFSGGYLEALVSVAFALSWLRHASRTVAALRLKLSGAAADTLPA